jgi:hypothetical protein
MSKVIPQNRRKRSLSKLMGMRVTRQVYSHKIMKYLQWSIQNSVDVDDSDREILETHNLKADIARDIALMFSNRVKVKFTKKEKSNVEIGKWCLTCK